MMTARTTLRVSYLRQIVITALTLTIENIMEDEAVFIYHRLKPNLWSGTAPIRGRMPLEDPFTDSKNRLELEINSTMIKQRYLEECEETIGALQRVKMMLLDWLESNGLENSHALVVGQPIVTQTRRTHNWNNYFLPTHVKSYVEMLARRISLLVDLSNDDNGAPYDVSDVRTRITTKETAMNRELSLANSKGRGRQIFMVINPDRSDSDDSDPESSRLLARPWASRDPIPAKPLTDIAVTPVDQGRATFTSANIKTWDVHVNKPSRPK